MADETDRVTDNRLDEIEARANAALTYQRSALDESDGMYAPTDAPARGSFTCPLCNEGEIEGQRFDDTGHLAATVVAYGIGDGLRAAEEWVERAPAYPTLDAAFNALAAIKEPQ